MLERLLEYIVPDAQSPLFGGDTVMLGNAFAGTTETPGETVTKSVVLPESQKVVRVPFKVFRGMASIGAMVLTTECLVAEKKEDKPAAGPPGGGHPPMY